MTIRLALLLALLFSGLLGSVGPTAIASADDWDPAVEYKLSLVRPVDGAEMEKRADEVARLWTAVAGMANADGFKWKDCRSVEFFDTPDHSLRKGGVLVRRRVERGKKRSCFKENGELREVDDEWKLTVKSTASSRADRVEIEGFDLETDWLAGASGDRVRYSSSKSAEGEHTEPPSEFEAIVARVSLAAGLFAGAIPARPICSKPAEEFRYRDSDAAGQPTVTFWQLGDRFIAAEFSFDGSPEDHVQAERMRNSLKEVGILAPEPKSKTAAAFAACPQ